MTDLLALGHLDGLITSFFASEEEDKGGESNAAFAQQVYAAVLAGDVQRALDLVQCLHPALLQDDRLLFKLRRQHFLELAQSDDPQRRRQALAVAKVELAPLALHAYPEAYAEFKHSMLSLLHAPAQPGVGPAQAQAQAGALGQLAAAEPAEASRQQLAGMLFRTIRESLGVRDPPFTVLLRYLLLVHTQQAEQSQHLQTLRARPLQPASRGAGAVAATALETVGVGPEGSSRAAAGSSGEPAQQQGGGGSKAGDTCSGEGEEDLDTVCRGLLLSWRDPMPLPSEGAPAHFPESHVQALRTSLGCDREEAVALMRRARGDKSAALRNAVQAVQLEGATVRRLAQDYAAFRGLDVPLPPLPEQAEPSAMEAGPDEAIAMDTAESCLHAAEPVNAMASAEEPGMGTAAVAAQLACAHDSPATLGSAQQQGEQLVGQQRQLVAGPEAAGEEGGDVDLMIPPAKIPRAGGRRSPKDSAASTPQEAVATAFTADFPGALLRADAASAEAAALPGRDALAVEPDAGCHTNSAAPALPPPQLQQQSSGDRDGSDGLEQGSRPQATRMSEQQVHALVKQLRRLLDEGMADQVEEQLLVSVGPGFIDDHPDATFLVRRCHFLQLLQRGGAEGPCGGTATALSFVRTRLSPLAQHNPSLQPLLKSCLGALLPAPGPMMSSISGAGSAAGLAGATGPAAAEAQKLQEAVADAAAAVHAALRQHFNIQEPLLLRLLGHLLVAHSVHFLAQHCKDGFEQELGIPQLRGPAVLPMAEAQWRAARQSRLPAAAAAPLAARAEEGLFGHMGPIFSQLRRIMGEAEPQPLFPGAVRVSEEAGGARRGGQQGDAALERQEEGGVPMDEGPSDTDEEDEDEDEDEGGAGGEDWQQEQAGASAEGGGEGAEAGGVEAVSEEAILVTQEFSGLPRGQAIELLMLFGSPQAVMAHLFP